MSDSNSVELSVGTTVNSMLGNVEVKNGQLLFIRDKRTVALDYDNKRTIYNQIEELDTEESRISLLAPVTGRYYFVIDPGILWTYQDGWVQLSNIEALDEDIEALFEN